MSKSLWPHGLQHTSFLCPLLPPRVCSNSCPLSWWCYPTISPLVAPFSSCPHSFPMSGSFPTSWLFTSSGQSIGASASASVLPMNIQGWFPLGWTGLMSRGLRSSGLLLLSALLSRYLLRGRPAMCFVSTRRHTEGSRTTCRNCSIPSACGRRRSRSSEASSAPASFPISTSWGGFWSSTSSRSLWPSVSS